MATPDPRPSGLLHSSILTGLDQSADGAVGSTLGAAGGGLSSLMDAPLPHGFDWIRLDQLSERSINELPNDDEYTGVSQESVKKGLELLRLEILPAIEQDPTVDSFYFEQSDRRADRDPSIGARSAYDAFFGDGAIVVDPTLDGTQWDITNGRHRIRIARESGWQVIPARIIGKK